VVQQTLQPAKGRAVLLRAAPQCRHGCCPRRGDRAAR
jgi:hypothetical protein